MVSYLPQVGNHVKFMVKFRCGTCTDAICTHFRSEDDTMQTLDTLAAHYVQEANKEKKNEKKRELFTKATVLVTTADKIVMHNARYFAQYID